VLSNETRRPLHASVADANQTCTCSNFSSSISVAGSINGVSIQSDATSSNALINGVNLNALEGEALTKTAANQVRRQASVGNVS